MATIVGLGLLNVVLALSLGPLFEGVVRKYVRAQVAHSRTGPLVGIWQPFYDLAKLLGKEDLECEGFPPFFRAAPMVALAAVLCAALLIPLAGRAPLAMGGDGLVLIYVLGIAVVALILTSMASGSPYAYAGATREMMMFLVVEPVLIIALICGMVHAHSWRIDALVSWQLQHGPALSLVVAGLALLLALPALFAKLPFDIPEADQEIMGGPLVEISGPKLALFKWTLYARQFVLAAVLVTVFVPWPGGLLWPLTLLLNLVKVCLAFVVVGLIDVVCPRLRVDQALAWYASVIVAAGVAVVLAVVGG